MNNIKTPNIRPLRTQGGTLYTFYSALEDIGLNINEQHNVVKLSHYAILQLPNNIKPLQCAPDGFVPADTSNDISESFRRYALNLENTLINRNNYNFTTSLNVSERVFWKWLKACEAIKFKKYNNDVVVEDTSTSVVKTIGKIDAVSQRTGTTGIYNEIYVNIPSSHGTNNNISFIEISDDNYKRNTTYDCSKNINNDENDGVSFADDTSTSELKNSYVIDSSLDCITLNFNLNAEDTYDSLATCEDSTDYDFNTILLYYTIYDKNGKELARNLYGVYFINNVEKNGEEYDFNNLQKKKTSEAGFGTSYSFKINLRTRSIYDSDVSIIDNSSSETSIVNTFNDVLFNLSECVNIMHNNTYKMRSLNTKIDDVIINNINLSDNIKKVENDISLLSSDIQDRNLSINDDFNIVKTNNLSFRIESIKTDNLNKDTTDNNNISNALSDVSETIISDIKDEKFILKLYANENIKYFLDNSGNVDLLSLISYLCLRNKFLETRIENLEKSLNKE